MIKILVELAQNTNVLGELVLGEMLLGKMGITLSGYCRIAARCDFYCSYKERGHGSDAP